ncbi:hypothetical protein SAMN03003324_02340 [Pedobacter antarcticus]|uniref:Uncharacterized protein n=1 Tax=Pedobacter antarcticus TaxID=34086 RepID=A0A1I2FQ77_9SPHI|nr:hypothetical protein SAMN03003324_02340 [Pedobacter antarcticus]
MKGISNIKSLSELVSGLPDYILSEIVFDEDLNAEPMRTLYDS